MTIVSLEGNAGAGKSTFMYSAPTPMVVCAFDAGSIRALYGAMHEMFTGIDIQIVPYPHLFAEQPLTKELMPMVKKSWKRNDGKAITIYMLPEPIQMGAKLNGIRYLWNAFKLIVDAALDDLEVPTVGIDTGTIMRQVAADAFLEKLQSNPKTADREQLIQIEWGKGANGPSEEIYSKAKQVSEYQSMMGEQKHLIVTHHLTDVYVKSVGKDGEQVSIPKLKSDGLTPYEQLKGLGSTYTQVDYALRMELVDVAGKSAGEIDTVIESTFMKAGTDLSLRNKKFRNLTWDTLADTVNGNLAPQAQVKKRG